ncbi:MAG TPA: hypothetical protein PK950_02860 [Candidatus Paceibacterota bacterium]|nr:hypothetical protein [Candidatus Paceibacterota bacterium]
MATAKKSSSASSSKSAKKKSGNTGAKVALVSAAVIAAGAAAYYLSDKKRRANAKDWMVKMKDEAVKKFGNMGEMSKEMYHEAIDKLADKYKSVKNASPAEIAMMVADMKRQWSAVSKKVKSVAKKSSAKKAIKKAVSSAKKAVKKSSAKKAKRA